MIDIDRTVDSSNLLFGFKLIYCPIQTESYKNLHLNLYTIQYWKSREKKKIDSNIPELIARRVSHTSLFTEKLIIKIAKASHYRPAMYNIVYAFLFFPWSFFLLLLPLMLYSAPGQLIKKAHRPVNGNKVFASAVLFAAASLFDLKIDLPVCVYEDVLLIKPKLSLELVRERI